MSKISQYYEISRFEVGVSQDWLTQGATYILRNTEFSNSGPTNQPRNIIVIHLKSFWDQPTLQKLVMFEIIKNPKKSITRTCTDISEEIELGEHSSSIHLKRFLFLDSLFFKADTLFQLVFFLPWELFVSIFFQITQPTYDVI